jgi:hypothetical protein
MPKPDPNANQAITEFSSALRNLQGNTQMPLQIEDGLLRGLIALANSVNELHVKLDKIDKQTRRFGG